jgi:uncharacterized RDD family membrane protein YckC
MDQPQREVWSPPRAPGRDPARPYLPSPNGRRSGGAIPGQRPASSDPVGFPPVRDEGDDEAPRPTSAPVSAPLWWERYLARAIDTALFVVVWLTLTGIVSGILFTGLGLVGRLGYALVGAIPTILAAAGYAYYDHRMHARDGQTLGKKALGLRLVSAAGGPVDPATSKRRAVLYPGVLVLVGPLGLIPALSGLLPTLAAAVTVVAAIPIVTDPRARTWADRRAGTRVVKDAVD